ncbi:MAG: hypothetical protein HYR94_01890 [Chloroflexi bacterium]|nr:hypothetical protein [Chloroflexota bacterium]
MSMLDDAIQAIRMGDKEEGRRLLEETLETDESNEEVWLWLTAVVDTDEDREVCLENVLALNPNNAIALRNLDALKSGNFNAGDIIRSAIESEPEEEEPIEGTTFIDEFRRSSELDEDEDDELVMPSTMAKSKKAAKKKGGGFKLNPRLIVLAIFVLLIICALGGVAVYNLVGGGVGPSNGQVETETPAGSETQPATEPAAIETPVEPPTNTPVPTKPALELPTPKPTELPTPTSTPVVLPTVGGSQ